MSTHHPTNYSPISSPKRVPETQIQQRQKQYPVPDNPFLHPAWIIHVHETKPTTKPHLPQTISTGKDTTSTTFASIWAAADDTIHTHGKARAVVQSHELPP